MVPARSSTTRNGLKPWARAMRARAYARVAHALGLSLPPPRTHDVCVRVCMHVNASERDVYAAVVHAFVCAQLLHLRQGEVERYAPTYTPLHTRTQTLSRTQTSTHVDTCAQTQTRTHIHTYTQTVEDPSLYADILHESRVVMKGVCVEEVLEKLREKGWDTTHTQLEERRARVWWS